jgi:hypothetical protein
MRMFDGFSTTQERWAYGLGCLLPQAQIKSVASTLKIPNELSHLASVVAQVLAWVDQGPQADVDAWAHVLGAVDVYRKPERLHQAVCVLFQVLGDGNPVLSVFQCAVEDQIRGGYTQQLRAYLAQQSDEGGVAERVLHFKRAWVCQLLSEGGSIALKK